MIGDGVRGREEEGEWREGRGGEGDLLTKKFFCIFVSCYLNFRFDIFPNFLFYLFSNVNVFLLFMFSFLFTLKGWPIIRETTTKK